MDLPFDPAQIDFIEIYTGDSQNGYTTRLDREDSQLICSDIGNHIQFFPANKVYPRNNGIVFLKDGSQIKFEGPFFYGKDILISFAFKYPDYPENPGIFSWLFKNPYYYKTINGISLEKLNQLMRRKGKGSLSGYASAMLPKKIFCSLQKME